MGKVDLVIKGGRVAVGGVVSQSPVWIAVDGGRIVSLGNNASWPEATQTIDASGKYVLPGAIDPEHHPISHQSMHAVAAGGETIISETSAAVAGGVTTIGMMHHSTRFALVEKKPDKVEDVPRFMEVFPPFIEMAKGQSMVDYFLTPEMSTEEHAKEIPQLAEKLGVTSFKLYLHCKAGEHMWPMWPYMQEMGMFYYDDGMIFRAMRNIASLGPPGLLLIHPENWEIARVLKEDMIAQGRTSPAAWDDHAPAFTEAGHVHTYSYYARVTGCPLYLVHCTTPETLEEVVKARADGVNITAQGGVQYLTLDKERGVVNVPLRSKDTHEKLWEAVRTGIIDCIGSDHVWGATIPLEDVEKYGTEKYPFNIWERWYLFAGRAEALLPIMLSEGVSKGRLSLERVVKVCSENTARKLGLYPKKGVIAIGSDADFVIVDLNKTKTLTRDMTYSAQGWSIWEGWEIKGWPVMTILRGNVIMEWPEGEPRPKIVGKPIGQYLPRKPGSELYPLD